jgi:hypothetical protein
MSNLKTLRPFVKGVSGNPKGRPKNPLALKNLKLMTKGEFSLLIHKLIDLKPEDLATFKGTVLEMAMASAMQTAIKTGDFSRIQSLIERLFGKVKDEVSTDAVLKIIIEDYSKK